MANLDPDKSRGAWLRCDICGDDHDTAYVDAAIAKATGGAE